MLFRSGVLSQLEGKRDELLTDRIIQLQAYCRGFLARRRTAQTRVQVTFFFDFQFSRSFFFMKNIFQNLAVRCIQRNVKAFLSVRDWQWWRLLVRIRPLLNVHRTEEELKLAIDELKALKAKLAKTENDRNLLRTENMRLESKVSQFFFLMFLFVCCVMALTRISALLLIVM